MAVSEKSKKNLRKEGNPTGALNKAKLENMKAMADFGSIIRKKVQTKIVKGLDSEDLNQALKSCEIVLKYTCAIPKDTSDEQGTESKLQTWVFEKLEALQAERDDLLQRLEEKEKKK